MKKVKLFEQYITEGKDVFPNEIVGNDQILFKKEWEKMNGGKLAAKYNQYYRGYDIDFGGHIFGSVDELERFMKDYVLSNNLYNKYKNMPEKQIGESIVNESLIDALVPVAALLTWWSPWLFAMWLAGTESGQDFQNSPSWKEQYKKWKSDAAVTKIVSRLEGDEDIKEFLLLPRTKQRGQWQKLIASKLTDSEMAYLKKINKGPFYSL